MRFYSHICFAFLLSGFFVNQWNPLLFLLVFLAAVLPDIDHPYSSIGSLMPRISKYLFKHFGHRGLLHSIYIPVTLVFDFFYWQNNYYLVFGMAYFSHILLDMITKTGVKLLPPLDYSFTIFDGEYEASNKKTNITISIISIIGFFTWLLLKDWFISFIT